MEISTSEEAIPQPLTDTNIEVRSIGSKCQISISLHISQLIQTQNLPRQTGKNHSL